MEAEAGASPIGPLKPLNISLDGAALSGLRQNRSSSTSSGSACLLVCRAAGEDGLVLDAAGAEARATWSGLIGERMWAI